MTEEFTIKTAEERDGAFVRQQSRFRDWVTADGTSGFAPEAGRYHLYVVARLPVGAPHDHRPAADGPRGRDLDLIRRPDPRRARLGLHRPGRYEDPVNGFAFLSEAYLLTRPGVRRPRDRARCCGTSSAGRSSTTSRRRSCGCSRPCSRRSPSTRRALSADAGRPRSTSSTSASTTRSTTASTRRASAPPERLRARGPGAVRDARRARRPPGRARRFLFGREPLETDWRLFTTLIRFDAVYQIHFKCSLRKLAEYPNLWPYLRDLYQWPGIAETVSFDEIRAHYYRTHSRLNPQHIVAVMPALDFDAPHHRHDL